VSTRGPAGYGAFSISHLLFTSAFFHAVELNHVKYVSVHLSQNSHDAGHGALTCCACNRIE
jgi:hypothetical protein